MTPLDGGDSDAAPNEAPETELEAPAGSPPPEPGDLPAPPEDDGLDEIQFDKEKYRVPKPLKEKIESWRSGTARRDQEIAAERKALRERMEQVSSLNKEVIQKHGQLAHADDMLSRYQRLNWNALDRDTATVRSIEWQQWKDYKDSLERSIGETEATLQSEARRETESRLEEAVAVLKRDIPNWDEISAQVGEYAIRELGYTRDDLAKMTDPRLGRQFYLAWRGSQLEAAQKAAARKASTEEVDETPRPAPRVRGTAPAASASPSDRDDVETWIRKRERQLKARRA